jgi:hypothetical protein
LNFSSSKYFIFCAQRRQAAKGFFFAPLRLRAATLYFFASLRLCCLARSIAGRYSFFDSSCAIFLLCAVPVRRGGFFFSQSRQAAKRFFFAPSHLCEATLHFFASLRLCAITPFLKNSLKGYLQSL